MSSGAPCPGDLSLHDWWDWARPARLRSGQTRGHRRARMACQPQLARIASWRALQGSNMRPQARKTGDCPTELRVRLSPVIDCDAKAIVLNGFRVDAAGYRSQWTTAGLTPILKRQRAIVPACEKSWSSRFRTATIRSRMSDRQYGDLGGPGHSALLACQGRQSA